MQFLHAQAMVLVLFSVFFLILGTFGGYSKGRFHFYGIRSRFNYDESGKISSLVGCASLALSSLKTYFAFSNRRCFLMSGIVASEGHGDYDNGHSDVKVYKDVSSVKDVCPMAPILDNGTRVSLSGLHVGAEAMYRCNEGYSLCGHSNTSTCQDTGNWTPSVNCTESRIKWTKQNLERVKLGDLWSSDCQRISAHSLIICSMQETCDKFQIFDTSSLVNGINGKFAVGSDLTTLGVNLPCDFKYGTRLTATIALTNFMIRNFQNIIDHRFNIIMRSVFKVPSNVIKFETMFDKKVLPAGSIRVKKFKKNRLFEYVLVYTEHGFQIYMNGKLIHIFRHKTKNLPCGFSFYSVKGKMKIEEVTLTY